MYVKFTCTIRGTPDPKVTWYHNLIAIEPATLQPGTMRISSQFGVHTLEIFQYVKLIPNNFGEILHLTFFGLT